jgi:hypothetical protein
VSSTTSGDWFRLLLVVISSDGGTPEGLLPETGNVDDPNWATRFNWPPFEQKSRESTTFSQSDED